MDPAAIAALVNLGVGGIGLYAFATGRLLAKPVVDAMLAAIQTLYDAALLIRDQRIIELKQDRDEWKRLALGIENRLDRVTPIVATVVGVSPADNPGMR